MSNCNCDICIRHRKYEVLRTSLIKRKIDSDIIMFVEKMYSDLQNAEFDRDWYYSELKELKDAK